MIGLLIFCLIGLALGIGFSKAHYILWGFNIISFKHAYYRLGLQFEPYTVYDEKGDIYSVDSLKIGFIAATIWIDFYTYKGNNGESSTTTNLTTYDPTVITTTPII